MTRAPRSLCPKCRYPMMKLSNFEGESSRDAPGFGDSDNSWVVWGGAGIVWAIMSSAGKGVGLLFRKRKAKKMREEILPQHPFTLICPQCWTLEKRA